MNLEKLFGNLSKILSEKENAKIEIKVIKKEVMQDEPISTPGGSSEKSERTQSSRIFS